MLGNKNTDSTKLLILKVKTRDAAGKDIEPIFQVNEKNPETGKWGPVSSTPTVSGDLVRADVKEGEFDGQKTYNISVYLRDLELNETYLVDLKLNILSRGLLNSILNLANFKDVKISLYTNAKGYAAASLRQNGEMVKWKYSLNEIPPAVEVQFKGKTQRDFTPSDEFFVEKVKDFAADISAAAQAPKKEKIGVKENDLVGEAAGESDEDSDLF